MSAPADKPALRAHWRARRRALAAAAPEAADQAGRAFAEFEAASEARSILAGAGVVAVYHPLGGELDPGPLAAVLRAAGARIALPVALAPGAPLVFRLPVEGAPLPRDAAGVRAPGPEAPEAAPDLVVTPLLAFDRSGARLGQGGGYYDRTLQALRARGPVFALGLAYAGQESADLLPGEPHDQRLDAVLTQAGLTRFAT